MTTSIAPRFLIENRGLTFDDLIAHITEARTISPLANPVIEQIRSRLETRSTDIKIGVVEYAAVAGDRTYRALYAYANQHGLRRLSFIGSLYLSAHPHEALEYPELLLCHMPIELPRAGRPDRSYPYNLILSSADVSVRRVKATTGISSSHAFAFEME